MTSHSADSTLRSSSPKTTPLHELHQRLGANLVDFANVLAPTAIVTGGGSLALGNLAGLPAVSVPCGFTASNLPLGIQLIGPAFDEAGLLRIAHAYEQGNSWVGRHPRI